MNKKIIIGIVVVIIVILVVIGYFIFKDNNKDNDKKTIESNNGITTNENESNDKNALNGKTLVVYYSASGSTKKVAEQISKNLSAEIFEIIPEDIYTSDDLDWTDDNSRVSREHNNESLRDVKLNETKVNNWENYDTVLIGYPIWWGIAAWPVDNFVKDNDFAGKTVIPFCTSASSDLGQSGELLESMAKGGNWQKGKRFSSSSSNSDIKSWTDSLK